MNEKYVFGGEIAMIFVALQILMILKDDMKRLKRNEIIQMVKRTQMISGWYIIKYRILYKFSFSVSPFEKDTDMRFCYCAIAICAILDCFNVIDVSKLILYVESCFVLFKFILNIILEL